MRYLSLIGLALIATGASYGQDKAIFKEPWNRPTIVKRSCGFGTNLGEDNANIEISAHFSLRPQVHASNYGIRFPVVQGTSDLPEGTKVVVEIWPTHLPDAQQRIAEGIIPCAGNCDPAITNDDGSFAPRAVVKNGRFSAGPFSLGGVELIPGVYRLEIYVPAGCVRTVGQVSDKEFVDRWMESFRKPAYRGLIQVP